MKSTNFAVSSFMWDLFSFYQTTTIQQSARANEHVPMLGPDSCYGM